MPFSIQCLLKHSKNKSYNDKELLNKLILNKGPIKKLTIGEVLLTDHAQFLLILNEVKNLMIHIDSEDKKTDHHDFFQKCLT